MKKQLNKAASTIAVFAFILIGLACNNNAPQNNTANNKAPNNNTNQTNTVQNSNSNSENDGESAADYNCDGDAAEKITKVNTKMLSNIQNDPTLNGQYVNKNFKFEAVADAQGDVVLHIWGFVYTDEPKVDKLNKIYKKFLKKKCITKVIFGKAPDNRETSADRFNFELCEAPNIICSDGTCQPACKSIADTNTNSNSNKSPNTNSNPKETK